jgi:uncharacterized protein YndB with AHSA1/START domain
MDQGTFTVKRDELKVVMERTFNAPIDQVFKALTDPAVIPLWWGKRSQTTRVDEMEVKVGGAWRFVCRDQDGTEYAFHGVYLAIDPPRRISQTFNFEGIPGDHELVETLSLEHLGGKTKVTNTSVYANLDDLDGMVASGMEAGARETWDRLAEIVENAPARAR